jgi:hypothetical protein
MAVLDPAILAINGLSLDTRIKSAHDVRLFGYDFFST